MIVLVSLIVLLRELLVCTIFRMVHPYIAIHSVELFLHLYYVGLRLSLLCSNKLVCSSALLKKHNIYYGTNYAFKRSSFFEKSNDRTSDKIAKNNESLHFIMVRSVTVGCIEA